MGTTAQKLQAIKNSKTAIKNAIASKGVAITDNTLLSEYAGKINDIPTGGQEIQVASIGSNSPYPYYTSNNTMVSKTECALNGTRIKFSSSL